VAPVFSAPPPVVPIWGDADAGWSDLPEPAPEPAVSAWLDPTRRRRLDDEQRGA
jgi:hypothetical protein